MQSEKRASMYHVHEVIRNLSGLVVRRVRESENRTQFSDFAFEVCQNFLVALIGFDLAHGSRLQFSGDLIKVSLLVTFQRVFELCTQTTLSTLAVSVSGGEFGFLALEHER
jgi:hypothetical protein